MKDKMSHFDVIIADAQSVFRAGLRATLAELPYIDNIYECTNGIDTLQSLHRHPSPLVFLDYKMHEMNGACCAKEICMRHPETKIIAMAMNEDASHAMEMFDNGASGYLLKNTDIDEIENAIESVMRGNYYFAKEVSGFLVKRAIQKLKGLTSDSGPSFTEREIDILRLLYAEYSSKEIGDKLCISPRTVDDYRNKLLCKTNSRNVVGLVKFALKRGIVGDLMSA